MKIETTVDDVNKIANQLLKARTKKHLDLCEKALWGLLHTNPLKPLDTENSLSQQIFNDLEAWERLDGFGHGDTIALHNLIMDRIRKNTAPYNHGFHNGWQECQKLGIDLIERVIAELKPCR